MVWRCETAATAERISTWIHRCGSRNPRVQNRCSKCGHRLHRSSHEAHFHSDSKFKLFLVVVVLVALYFVVRWLAAPPGFPALPPGEPLQ